MQNKLYIFPSRKPGHTSKHNLLVPLTPLIGREQEVSEVCTLLRHPSVRLMTFTGTGGVGKTRLSLQVAAELLDNFAEGVCFVPLASISNAELVIPAIARALELRETDEREQGQVSSLQHLKAFLHEKQLLLLLDNFEQVVTAAPELSDLLMACPDLKILVTSREVLRIHGEHEFPVPPLAVPDIKRLPEREVLPRYAAIELFIQQAQAIRPNFQMTNDNANAIAEICIRLDGIPLAIELAAARIKLLSPHALLARLDHRLEVLTNGARNMPARQQTLRNAIEWSYQLLDAHEQRLFRHLSVFVGGCTLEAVEAVSIALGDRAERVLDDVTSLVDKSLLQYIEQEGEEPRLQLLETIREYGLECLAASADEKDMEVTRQAHTEYYLAFAEKADPELTGPHIGVWLERLEREHDNLRAALSWSIEQGEQRQDMEMALRFGDALELFWFIRGHANEGLQWLERALAGSTGSEPLLRGKALNAAGMLALKQNKYDRAHALGRESLALFRKLGNKQWTAFALFVLGSVAMYRDRATVGGLGGRPLFEEALALFKEVGDTEFTAWTILRVAQLESEHDKAYALFEESLALFRMQGNKYGMASSLSMLAKMLFLSQGDPARLRSLLEESLTIARELNDKSGIADILYRLGRLVLSQSDTAKARVLAEESLALFRERGEKVGAASSLALLAKVATVQGDYRAARVLYEESLALAGEVLEYTWHIASCLEGLATVVTAQESEKALVHRIARGEAGEPETVSSIRWAAQLWGAAEALREAIKNPIPSIERTTYERSVAAAREHIGEKALDAAWAEGRAMSPKQALAAHGQPMKLQQLSPKSLSTLSTKASAYPAGLTAREAEVLRLLAMGLTSTQIAEQLVISLLTVNTHVRSIYSKLGVTSRSAATRYAIMHNLI